MTALYALLVIIWLFATVMIFILLRSLLPGLRKHAMLTILMVGAAGVCLGTIAGVHRGQRELLENHKSLYLPKIVLIPDKKHPRLTSLAKVDTVWESQGDFTKLYLPITQVSSFRHKGDTLWSEAVFYFTAK